MKSSVLEKFESMQYGPAPEDASEVTRWLDARGRRFGHFVNGDWISAGEEALPTRNPATGEVLAAVAKG